MRIHSWQLGPMKNLVHLLDDEAGTGALVDPAFDVPRLLELVQQTGVRVTHILVTHGHEDHMMGAPEARRALGARIVAHETADHPHDESVRHGDELKVGTMTIRFHHTPGHRHDAVCIVANNQYVLTGDTLFVGDCGRVDLPGSDPRAMHHTLLTTLRALPDHLIVLPGHDYGPTPTSTMRHEKATNPTLQPRSLTDFLTFMNEP